MDYIYNPQFVYFLFIINIEIVLIICKGKFICWIIMKNNLKKIEIEFNF